MRQIQIQYGQQKLHYQSRWRKWTTLLALLGMVLVACAGPPTPSGASSPVTANDSPDRTESPTVGGQRGDMRFRGGEAQRGAGATCGSRSGQTDVHVPGTGARAQSGGRDSAHQ